MQTSIVLPPLKTLGARLRHVRQARKMSQEALAAPEFHKSYVRAVEHGKIGPSRPALAFLAQRLTVPLAYLQGGALPTGLIPQLAALEQDLAYQIDCARREIDLGSPAAAVPLLAAPEAEYALYWQDISPAIRYRLYYTRGAAYIRLGQPAVARTDLDRAVPLTMYITNGAEAAERIRNAVGATFYLQDQFVQAVALHTECLRAVNNGIVTDLNLQLLIYSNLASDYLALHDHAAAIVIYKDALQLLDDVSNRERRAAICWGLSLAYKAEDNWPWARVYALQALDLYAAAGNGLDHALMQINLAELHLERHEYDSAGDLLEAARLFLAGPEGNAGLLSRAYEHLAALALARGDLAQAAAHAEQSVGLSTAPADDATTVSAAVQAHALRTHGRALCIAGQVAERQGQPALADRWFARALAVAMEIGPGELLHEVRLQYAELLTARGAHAAATHYYQAAVLPDRHRRAAVC